MFSFQLFLDSEDSLDISEGNDLVDVRGVSSEKLPKTGLIAGTSL